MKRKSKFGQVRAGDKAVESVVVVVEELKNVEQLLNSSTKLLKHRLHSDQGSELKSIPHQRSVCIITFLHTIRIGVQGIQRCTEVKCCPENKTLQRQKRLRS